MGSLKMWFGAFLAAFFCVWDFFGAWFVWQFWFSGCLLGMG